MLEERSRRVARVGQGPPGGGAEGNGGAGPWLGPGQADRLRFLIAPLIPPPSPQHPPSAGVYFPRARALQRGVGGCGEGGRRRAWFGFFI